MGVQAESIERALEIAKKQNLVRNCEVTVPINSDAFFVTEPAATSGPGRPKYGGASRPVEVSILTGCKRTFAIYRSVARWKGCGVGAHPSQRGQRLSISVQV